MTTAKKEVIVNHRPLLNPCLSDKIVKQKISQAFKNGSEYSDSSVTISSYPFTHCIVKNFIADSAGKRDDFLKYLRPELMKLDFNEKSNDLYKFCQSFELMVPAPASPTQSLIRNRKHLNHLCALFRETLLPWMQEITGAELNETIDMFSAQYKYTDVLLCHDDELEDRRIAYILYLSEDWTEKDGGSLDLFTVNEKGHPDQIVKSLVPSFNSFVFFEVSPVSYHQVSEILSKTKTRLSLSGWFHGSPLPRPDRPQSPRAPAITFLPIQQDNDLLAQWVSPRYLSISTQGTIQEQFEGTSEIQLPDFLLTERYKLLSDSILHLSHQDEFWENRGPANKRNYFSMKFDQDFELLESECPSSSSKSSSSSNTKKLQISLKTMEAYNLVNDFVRLFCSEEMFLYMSNVTGLSFHPMATSFNESSGSTQDDDSGIPEKRARLSQNAEKEEVKKAGLNSKCRYEIRRWNKGCYTLLSDTDSDRGEYALDVTLQCNAEGWEQENGGFTTYIAQGEDMELLTVIPSSNCLSLAYRDSEALRFVKHVNQRSTKSFLDFSFVYFE